MITVFLDSNVLISALIGSAHSAPVVLVDWLASSPAAALITGRRCIQEVENKPCAQAAASAAAVATIREHKRYSHSALPAQSHHRH